MKALIWITALAAVVCILLTSLQAPYQAKEQTPEESVLVYESSEKSEQSEQAATEGYVLKEYQGRLGVFAKSNDTPLFISEVLLSNLPSCDQTEIKKGIPVTDRRSLNRLLEELCS